MQGQNQLMKSMAAQRQEVRSLLTDEQKIQFDSRTVKKGRRSKMNRCMGFSGSPNPETAARMPE